MEYYKSLIGRSNKSNKSNVSIVAERANFIFLSDGSMVYDYYCFDSFLDAMLDAIKNHGEDIDDMISLCFTQRNKNLKQQIEELLENY